MTEPKKPTRQLSDELRCMARIERLLEPLPPSARRRVVAWLTDAANNSEPSESPAEAFRRATQCNMPKLG